MRTLLRLSALLLLVGPALAQDQKGEDINKPFENENLDVESYVKRFETESREVYKKRADILEYIDLKPGMVVADVGAGTGLFTRLFAEEVGPEGKVFAVDISPRFLEYIKRKAKERGQAQVVTVLGSQDSTKLPKGSVDVLFLADVYHHFEDPDVMLASIRDALKPGGRFVIVEFDRASAKSEEFVKKHVRADKETFLKEIKAAGFAPITEGELPDLQENFIAAFRKPEASGAGGPGK
jgi:ubiquinone/menaquinone biosynthesis C-methylase UbiE